MFLLRVGFSRCLQALVYLCGFHVARGESDGVYYCDVLVLNQLLPDICRAAVNF